MRAAVLAAAALVVAVQLPPFAALAWQATREAPLGLLADTALWRLFGISLWRATVVTGAALAVGVPLGVLLGRCDIRGRAAALLLHALPLFLPPFLGALGWFHLAGSEGYLGNASTSAVLFGEAGAIAVQVLAFAPVVTLLVALGLHAVDPTLEEAARVVARPATVVRGILLPMAWRPAALAGLLVFALAFAELGVPMFLRVRAYPAAVFARLGGLAFAPGEALVLVLPLLAVALLLLAAVRRLGARAFALGGLRRDRPPLPLGRWRLPATLLAWTAAGLAMLPLAALIARALGSERSGAGWSRAADGLGPAVLTSVATSAAAATLITAAGLVLGWALARNRAPAGTVDTLMMLSFVAPASVTGVGLIAVWNHPATDLIYGTSAILVLGFVAHYAVLGSRALAIAIAHTPAHLEEAAAIAGAGFGVRLHTIVAPLHARTLAGAWLLAFVFCLRDLDSAALYYPPGGQPLAVRILTLEANGADSTVAALASVQVAVTAAVVLAGFAFLRKRA